MVKHSFTLRPHSCRIQESPLQAVDTHGLLRRGSTSLLPATPCPTPLAQAALGLFPGAQPWPLLAMLALAPNQQAEIFLTVIQRFLLLRAVKRSK